MWRQRLEWYIYKQSNTKDCQQTTRNWENGVGHFPLKFSQFDAPFAHGALFTSNFAPMMPSLCRAFAATGPGPLCPLGCPNTSLSAGLSFETLLNHLCHVPFFLTCHLIEEPNFYSHYSANYWKHMKANSSCGSWLRACKDNAVKREGIFYMDF